MSTRPVCTLGFDEEHRIVDCETRDLGAKPSPDSLSSCQDRVTNEYLQCQIEVGPNRIVPLPVPSPS